MQVACDVDKFEEAVIARELCPLCCAHYLVPGTRAAEAFGVCPSCHYRAFAEAKREQAAAIAAEREYHAARRQLQRAHKSAGREGL